jgi:hypothetical protein
MEGSDVSINLQLSGLPPNTVHGWHIHDKPVADQNCTTAGLHFNPNTINGRGIVIHEKDDDLGLVDNDGSRAVGNAGGRLACGNVSGELNGGKPAGKTDTKTNGNFPIPVGSTISSGVSHYCAIGFFWTFATLLF